jgi:hypothetical protein
MSAIGEAAQLIIAIGVLLNAVISGFGAIQSWRNGRIINQVAKQTDGINSQLVTVTAQKEFAAGVKHGEEHPRENGDAPAR